ncbi:MAG: cation diffusion facilitator family transporter, partial [Desulfurococcales archaeon]|nr:cation diffusion facilitator family transporter [Desulfurococcales archaeon]
MRVVYFSFLMNALGLALKALSLTTSTSSAVDAEFLHSLGDFIGSGLLAVGAAMMFRKPTLKHPFGYGRTVYVLGLISTAIVGGFLFSVSLAQGIDQLRTMSAVRPSDQSIMGMSVAAALDLGVLGWALKEYRHFSSDPSVKGTVIENLADSVGDVAALIALTTSNPLADAYGALTISGILLVSSASLGWKYFNVLIGTSAPKNVVGRAIKVALSLPYVIDVNDVKSLVIGPDEYVLIMQV